MQWNHVKNATGEDCVAQTISDGKWNAEDCFKQKPFVCSISATPTNAPYVKCGYPWFYMESTGFCYGGVSGNILYTWEDAEAACEKAGKDSHLASIHNDDEMNFVHSMVAIDWKWFWIGMYTVDKERSWRWTDKTEVDYISWQPNYPNLNASACIGVNYGFMDLDCNTKLTPMCKRKP